MALAMLFKNDVAEYLENSKTQFYQLKVGQSKTQNMSVTKKIDGKSTTMKITLIMRNNKTNAIFTFKVYYNDSDGNCFKFEDEFQDKSGCWNDGMENWQKIMF